MVANTVITNPNADLWLNLELKLNLIIKNWWKQKQGSCEDPVKKVEAEGGKNPSIQMSSDVHTLQLLNISHYFLNSHLQP